MCRWLVLLDQDVQNISDNTLCDLHRLPLHIQTWTTHLFDQMPTVPHRPFFRLRGRYGETDAWELWWVKLGVQAAQFMWREDIENLVDWHCCHWVLTWVFFYWMRARLLTVASSGKAHISNTDPWMHWTVHAIDYWGHGIFTLHIDHTTLDSLWWPTCQGRPYNLHHLKWFWFVGLSFHQLWD